jgi:hypothetical protein
VPTFQNLLKEREHSIRVFPVLNGLNIIRISRLYKTERKLQNIRMAYWERTNSLGWEFIQLQPIIFFADGQEYKFHFNKINHRPNGYLKYDV